MVFAMDKRKRLNYRKSDVCRVLDGNFAELSLGGVFLHTINNIIIIIIIIIMVQSIIIFLLLLLFIIIIIKII